MIAGIQRLTLLDFPGHPACTVFLPGCDFRCHYCHNPEFVLPEKMALISKNFIPESAFFRFLEQRKGLLEGVCITGGEPTIHQDLPEFLSKIREIGFLVKLDTNGTNPKMLSSLIEKGIIDYVAMDIKASPERYSEFVGVHGYASLIEEAKKIIFSAPFPVEFRTTLVREFHDEEECIKIFSFLSGAKRYFLQSFRGTKGCLDKKWEQYSAFSHEEMERKREIALSFGIECMIRT
jgi:pyruvate formate lyase activating enzyme